MNKTLKTILGIIGIILIFVLIFVLSEVLKPKYLKEITMDEYKEIIKEKDSYIYIGSKGDNYSILEDFAKENKIKLYYLKNNKIKEKDSLVEYKKGKEVLSISDFTSYKFKKELIKSGLISNQVLEVTIPEYFEIIKEDEYNFMFLGSATCGYCTKFKPVLAEVANDYDVNLYYIDLYNADQEDLQTLYSSDEYFTTEEWGTPLNFLMKNGQRIAVLSGYNEYDSVIEFFKTNGVINND